MQHITTDIDTTRVQKQSSPCKYELRRKVQQGGGRWKYDYHTVHCKATAESLCQLYGYQIISVAAVRDDSTQYARDISAVGGVAADLLAIMKDS
jgi:hypothetical protein